MTDPHATSRSPFSPRMLTLTALIVGAVAVRLLIHFVPGSLPYNFTPVEAMALFGGALFADRRLALAVPLLAMFIADLIIGLHMLIPLVYALIAATVWLGGTLRGQLGAGRIALAAIISTTGFYLATNFAVWAMGTMYPHTASGLAASYVAGLPFYQWQLVGSLLWCALLFGGFALLTRRFPALAAPQPIH